MTVCKGCGKPTNNPKYCSRHCALLTIGCRTGRYPKPELNRKRKPTELDKAWAAGFWEGKGSCMNTSPTAANGGNSPGAAASQSTLWPLERLQVLYGGSIRNSNGPKEAPLIWRVYGDRAVVFLTDIYNLVSPRRQGQIEKALKGRK